MSKRMTESDFQAYVIWVENEGDYYHSPEGVFVMDSEGRYRVYSLDSRHNFLRAVMLKFPLADLLSAGVLYKGAHLRLEDLAEFSASQFTSRPSVIQLLAMLHNRSPQQYFFLQAYVEKGV